MEKLIYSAVIVGSGISGLYTALKLAEECRLDVPAQQNKILLITKSTLGESNSYYAQGGMVAVLKDNRADNVELRIKDTLVAGAGLNDETTVKFISENSDTVVKDLLGFGVEFDRDENGNISGLNPMNFQAETANSLLKIIEEPQPGVTFIFLTRYALNIF